MARDPALLFYFQDWQGGTMLMSRHLKGCYMDLLCAQFNNGHLSLDEIKTFLGSDFGTAWPALQKKFVKDDKGLYYNKRLEDEQLRRQSFTKSRRENLNGSAHMENENETVNELEKRKEEFQKLVYAMTDYKPEMLKEFFDYWSEHNPGGKKMLWETKKVFDIKKRLARWKKNNEEHEAGKNKFQPGNGFPNHWDYKYAMSIMNDGQKLSMYYQSLREHGWKKKSETHWEKIN